MENLIQFVLMVLIGGLIGYITNKVAIKMLFRPINPIKIGPFTLQGVFPKRKDEMAVSLADTIEEELLSKDDLINQMLEGIDLEETKEQIKKSIVETVSANIPPMAKMFVLNLDELVGGFIDSQGDELFNDILDKVKDKAKEGMDIRSLVKKRIDELDFVEFEKIVFGLMNRELRHIEVIGLFLGMIIGAVQFLVTFIQI